MEKKFNWGGFFSTRLGQSLSYVAHELGRFAELVLHDFGRLSHLCIHGVSKFGELVLQHQKSLIFFFIFHRTAIFFDQKINHRNSDGNSEPDRQN